MSANSASLGVIVLAAGSGTRMKSVLHKVLHPVCGTPMGQHVINAARALEPANIAVVVGHQAEAVRVAFAAPDVTFVDQPELDGTAGAVRRCRAAMHGCDTVLVLNGDSPLIEPSLLHRLAASRAASPVSFATYRRDDPGRLGRVSRDNAGAVTGVVEAADYAGSAGAAEINAGQYCFDAAWLWGNVDRIPKSAKGEFYVTSLIAMAYAQHRPGVAVDADAAEVLGVDDRVRLAEAERLMRARILEQHMLSGVTIQDPATTYIDAAVRLAGDVTILANSHLLGSTTVDADCSIGPGTTLRNSSVRAGTTVQSSVIEDSTIGASVSIGPFSHIRGGATIGDHCEIHNYAEVKNSVLGRGVKMHHFSYMGDADVGEAANIAAGAITCNFDGVAKHRTTIGARAFIGCDTMLIAPITIGEDAFTATGAVVTKDVAPGERVAGVPARPMPRRESR
jgi:bifunctional UDP-N-acetylglucosamine pyrophosphorylase/glucosamine-1-phosphate N-acetyltransferase